MQNTESISWPGSTNANRYLFLAALFLLFSSQLSFGQLSCFGYGGGDFGQYFSAAWDGNNCLIAYGTYAGAYNSIQVVLDPYSKFGNGGYSVSGTLSGDLGDVQYNNPQVAPPVLTFPCTQIQPDEWRVLSAVTYYGPGTHLVNCDHYGL